MDANHLVTFLKTIPMKLVNSSGSSRAISICILFLNLIKQAGVVKNMKCFEELKHENWELLQLVSVYLYKRHTEYVKEDIVACCLLIPR